MTIKKFILFSLIIHIGFLIGLYFVPEEVKKKPDTFFARLISPEELQKTEIIPVQPPAGNRGPTSLPRRAPILPARPKYIPSDEKPVVPGLGKETGKQLPEGVIPGPVKSEEKGEGPDLRTRPGSTDGDNSNAKRDKPSDKPGYLSRAQLFDRGVIRDSARKEMAGARKQRDDSITFDTSDYRYAGYMRKLKEKIESIWVYPPEAAARGIYGDLKIRFTILKNGKLGDIELVRTSGYKMLDDAAIKALKDGEPYWPIPPEWGMESYTVPGHFIYSIYGYQLR